jgi:ABC-type multidrug transport system permease subunit
MESLAETVLAIHFLWIVWLVAGLPLGLWLGWPRLRVFHAVSIGLTLGMQLGGVFCPLTIVEEWLRGGGFSYGGSWLAAMLQSIIYLRVPPLLVMAVTACWVAATLASLILWPPWARQAQEPGTE